MTKLADISDVVFGEVQSYASPEADLIVFEKGQNIAFSPKRMFSIIAREKTSRGRHAHKACAQVFFCPSGSCKITLDDGKTRQTFLLDSADKMLLMPAGIWGEQDYLEAGTVLMVLCDREYDEADYLRDYDAFLKFRAGA